MKRDDWIGLGASLGMHLVLGGLCALWATSRPQTPAPGALQLEVGTFAQGRPVQQAQAATEDQETPVSESTPPSSEASQDAAPNETPDSEAASEPSTPVNLPEQEASTGDEAPPEDPPAEAEQDASPTTDASASPAPEKQATQGEAASSESEGGEPTGQAAGASTGEAGTADEEDKAAPFNIEGLDRTRLYGPVPQYTEKVNATIKVEITVSPEGRVVGQRLRQKANPSLEREVMKALKQWRFNPLPAGAPQENQTGVVTVRFRLE